MGQQIYAQPAPGLGVPPMQPTPYVPAYVPPYQQPQPQAAPAPSSSDSDEVKALRAEIARMKESEEMRELRAENERLRAGYRQPGMGAPPPPAAPALTAESIAIAVTHAIKAAGLGAPAAAAAPVKESDPIAAMRQGMSFLQELKKFRDQTGDIFDPGDPDPAPVDPNAPPPKPEADEMPYDIWDVGSKWGDGSPARLVRDKETGGIDLLGLALANPYPSQRLMDAAAKIMDRFGQKGLAGPPEEQQEEQLPPRHEPEPEPPAPNGQTQEPGWDNLS